MLFDNFKAICREIKCKFQGIWQLRKRNLKTCDLSSQLHACVLQIHYQNIKCGWCRQFEQQKRTIPTTDISSFVSDKRLINDFLNLKMVKRLFMLQIFSDADDLSIKLAFIFYEFPFNCSQSSLVFAALWRCILFFLNFIRPSASFFMSVKESEWVRER